MLPSPFHLVPSTAQRNCRLEAGEVAFRQDDKTRGLFYVLVGKIELRRFTEAGQSVIIHRAKGGETFAEASLFSENYHCDAIATTKCHLIELDRAMIMQMFYSDPDFALAIAKRFAGQNQNYRRKLEILAIKSAEKRVLAAIVEGLLNENIKDFAAEIGLTHEAVYRGLARLVVKGLLVKTGRGRYEVKL